MRLFGAVLVLVVVAYATGVTAPFLTWDDADLLVHNARVHAPGLAGLLALWSPADALGGRTIEWFPLRDTVWWLLWQLGGGASALPFHVVNLLAHAVCSTLVAALAVRLGVSQLGASIAALVFAVHPVHIEAVEWVSSLKYPLYLALLLAAVLAHLRWVDAARASPNGAAARGAAARWAVASLALLAGSLLCKALPVVAPALFLIVERARVDRDPLVVTLRRLVPATLMCVGALALFLRIGAANDVIIPPWGGSWTTHYQLVSWVAARYVQQALVPTDVRLYYAFVTTGLALTLRAAVGVVVIAAYVGGLVRARKNALAFTLLAWFPICLLPVMNIVPFPALFADRYLYAPSVAVCIAIGVLIARAPVRVRRIAAPLVVVTFAGVTAVRASLWHDEVGLWRAVLEDDVAAADPQPWLKLGDALGSSDPRAALDALHRAMNLPTFAGLMPAGRCAAHADASARALSIHDDALARRHVAAALRDCPTSAVAQNAAAGLAANGGDVAAELQSAEAAAAHDTRPGIVWNRGVARLHAGQLDAGVGDLIDGATRDPAALCPLARAIASEDVGAMSDTTFRAQAAARVTDGVRDACGG